jgi:hypothetical protein
MMFGSDGCAGPAEHPGGPAKTVNKDVRAFLRRAQSHTTSVRIVSMHDSNAVATAAGAGAGGVGSRREPGTDRTTTTRVSNSAGGATPSHSPRPSSSVPFFPSSSFFRSRVWSRAAKAVAIGGLSPTLFSSSQTLDARLRATITTPQKFRSPDLPVLGNALSFPPISDLVLAPRASSDVPRLQCYFHLDQVSRLVPGGAVVFAEPILSAVANLPNPDAPGVPCSGRNWILGGVGHVACWVLRIFAVFLGYEVLYSYYRRWRFREYLRL